MKEEGFRGTFPTKGPGEREGKMIYKLEFPVEVIVNRPLQGHSESLGGRLNDEFEVRSSTRVFPPLWTVSRDCKRY